MPGAGTEADRGTVQHHLDVPADSTPVVLAEADLQLVDVRIVGVDLPLGIGNLPVIRLAGLVDLPKALR